MGNSSFAKAERLLYIYTKLVGGDIVNKRELSEYFDVSGRSIQRDIDALRCYFSDRSLGQDIMYESASHGYRLITQNSDKLSNSEVLAVCKILLESRPLLRDEMQQIINKLVKCCVPEQNKKLVNELLANEMYHYIEPRHGKNVVDGLWELGQAIRQHRVIKIKYRRLKENKEVERTLEPVGIMFSEFYFYLTAFMRDIDRKEEFDNEHDIFPTIYRIDRIDKLTVTDESFRVPYSDRFEEGEFRKRVQFMYGGTLKRIKFKYTGLSVEAVLDRLPTAEIVGRTDDGGYIIKAEVFGQGIDMWLKSQGDYITLL